MSTTKEILVIESSICSLSTVTAGPEYTPVIVASTYTSSCPSASLEKHITALATATCTSNPDVPTTYQNSVYKTSSIKIIVDRSTNIAMKTVVLTSLPSSFLCNNITTLLVALPTSVEDVGYVETAECASFYISQLFADIHVNNACLSMSICASLLLHTCLLTSTIHRQPTSVVGDSCKAQFMWMMVAIFMIVLATIGAGATIVCSLMYFKKWSHTSKMSLKPSATLGEQGLQIVLERNQQKEALPYMV